MICSIFRKGFVVKKCLHLTTEISKRVIKKATNAYITQRGFEISVVETQPM